MKKFCQYSKQGRYYFLIRALSTKKNNKDTPRHALFLYLVDNTQPTNRAAGRSPAAPRVVVPQRLAVLTCRSTRSGNIDSSGK